ncbi:MAG: helix-turn-helix domain-containing protein [Myxococcaceae bacterium]|jgi:putative molybdopterin biosynthesis protein|nr:helix-turn-helix domain-containing protein [Myxococcaceae bacterium]
MVAGANRVRELREARGLSQLELAARSRLSRQSLGAIEAGRATPAVDVALRLAAVLEAPVEALFSAPEEPPLEVDLPSPRAGPRVTLAHIGDRWVALPLSGDEARQPADGLLGPVRGRRASAQLLRARSELRDTIVLAGCATGLSLLCQRLNLGHGPGRFRWVPCSSAAALRALSGGFAHVAGVHDEVVAAAHGRSSGRAVVTLARWEAGLLTRHADAGRLGDVAALAAPGVRLVLREAGAGARRLLERHARAAGVPLTRRLPTPLVESGHLEVARAIATGAADAGVATRDAALAFGLRFVPLAEERFDLVLPSALLDDARLARLFEGLSSRAMRADLAALGYDVRETGRRDEGATRRG